ncbi:chromodomain helicase DNA binding protein [Striga asiatica]|uniref:Chromodomain helicase DNA binding protein n=1 Tax=Striga asiatica TaxID=4170 RepID=A0A5A7PJ63_STRAF|nr:chromodomain helicase DNA binding protein [Striga asiatica]
MESSIASFHKEIEKLNKMQSKCDKVSSVKQKLCCHPFMLEGVEPEDPHEFNKQFREASGKFQLLDKMMVKLKEQDIDSEDDIGHKVTYVKHSSSVASDPPSVVQLPQVGTISPGESSSNGATFDVEMKDSSSIFP